MTPHPLTIVGSGMVTGVGLNGPASCAAIRCAINNFQENVDKVTPARAKEIVSRYFPGNNLQFVLIGKSSEIRDKVKKYGKITEKEIKTEGY